MSHDVQHRLQPPDDAWQPDGRIQWPMHPPDVWEVICTTCGDDGGRYAAQSAEIQQLRGPYAGEPAAREARERHVRET